MLSSVELLIKGRYSEFDENSLNSLNSLKSRVKLEFAQSPTLESRSIKLSFFEIVDIWLEGTGVGLVLGVSVGKGVGHLAVGEVGAAEGDEVGVE